jgi:putative hemolysin
MTVSTARPALTYPIAVEAVPVKTVVGGRYEVRFARSRADLDALLRLRFEVFNLELNEGLVESYTTGRDEDELDARFHHLMIVDRESDAVVGTYRMQTPEMAACHGGFYCSSEFDLTAMPPDVLDRSVEIGRACVARPHRNGRVLHLLWRGLASYLAWNRKTVLFGCCSLTSQDPALGVSTFRHLAAEGHLHEGISLPVVSSCVCEVSPGADLPAPHVPALFASYLNLGAKACGPPALDRHFRTIDFLVLLDVRDLQMSRFRSFFA